VALLSPVVLLILLELGLRLAGYGHPTSFWLKARRNGQEVLVENPKFGWRFFGPALSRSPLPLSVLAHKPAGAIRIIVLGESAAMGDPEPAYGFARQLEHLLEARHPEKKFEVINAAMTAINSHVIREIAADCAGLEADCWIVYAGNNEVVGPFGAGTVFGRQAPSLATVRLNLALKRTRVGQLLGRFFSRSGTAQEWKGMELFLGQQVPAADGRLKAVYGNFAGNLEAILRLGRESGAKVLLATMPVNLRDCPPFGSMHRPGLTAAEKGNWNKAFERGREAESKGRFEEAASDYDQTAHIDGDYAQLWYCRGRCELALGELDAARTNFLTARDLDTLRFRADTRLNGIIRQEAKSMGFPLVDAERECAKRSPQGIPGEEIFYDHVHLNFSGNYWLASLLVPEVEKELSLATGKPGALLSEKETEHRLAFTDFDRHRVYEEVRLRLQQPPFRSQSNYQERDETWAKVLEGLRKPPRDCLDEYRQAVGLAPDDWVLHANYARVLEAAGDVAGAEGQWREVARLVPQEPDAWFQLGNLSEGRSSLEEAEGLFREALKRKPECTEALNGLGLVCSAAGKQAEARAWYEAALKANSRFAAARINLAVLLANSGDPAGAAAQCREVLRTDTNNVAARINLARLLLADHRGDEAVMLYEEAVRLKPDDPVVHYNFANALGDLKRGEEAIRQYRAAIKGKPDFAEARYNLGLELARAGNVGEAATQFAAAVRLKPDFAEAHFNYGIALAKEQRYGEAAREFRETLRVEPNHAAAKAALDRALKLMDGG